MRRYLELGAGWVVRSHFIEYFRPAFADEQLSVHTWVPRFDQRSTPRRYLFVRDGDRTVLAEAETIWVFVDLASGRRRPIPAELLEAFDPMPEEREVRRALGLAHVTTILQESRTRVHPEPEERCPSPAWRPRSRISTRLCRRSSPAFRAARFPCEGLAEFKSSVDDLRLRLWGLMSAGTANDYRAFQERFRLRRTQRDLRRGGRRSARGHAEQPARGAGAAGGGRQRSRPRHPLATSRPDA